MYRLNARVLEIQNFHVAYMKAGTYVRKYEKTLQNDKCRILCDRDLILKIRPQELRVRYITKITFLRSKNSVCLNSNKT